MLSLTELTLLMYIYGYKNIMHNIEEMGVRLPKFSRMYFLGNWLVATPLVLVVIIIITWFRFSPCFYDDYIFPDGIQVSEIHKYTTYLPN